MFTNDSTNLSYENINNKNISNENIRKNEIILKNY